MKESTKYGLITIACLLIGSFGSIMMVIEPGNDISANIATVGLIICFHGLGIYHGYMWKKTLALEQPSRQAVD